MDAPQRDQHLDIAVPAVAISMGPCLFGIPVPARAFGFGSGWRDGATWPLAGCAADADRGVDVDQTQAMATPISVGAMAEDRRHRVQLDRVGRPAPRVGRAGSRSYPVLDTFPPEVAAA